jgi:hypothetical protein
MSCGRISNKGRRIIGKNNSIVSPVTQIKSYIKAARKRNIRTAVQIIPTLIYRRSSIHDGIIKADILNVISNIKRTLQ